MRRSGAIKKKTLKKRENGKLKKKVKKKKKRKIKNIKYLNYSYKIKRIK